MKSMMTTDEKTNDVVSQNPELRSVLEGVLHELGCAEAETGGSVEIIGADPVAPSPHRLGEAASVALAALGTEMAALWRDRSGQGQNVVVRVVDAINNIASIFFCRANGVPAVQLWEPNLLGNCAFYPSRTGRSVFIMTSYPHMRDVACDVLDCAPLKAKMAAAVTKWDPFELEDAICNRGSVAMAVRTREEWLAHPQGQWLSSQPLVRIEKIGDAPPEPFPALGEHRLPLSGLRVLDNTHVLAGPVSARIMAEYGAQVLQISHPAYPDPLAFVVETGGGKRAAYCNLSNPDEAAVFWKMLTRADVYTTSYLGLDAKGYSPAHLVAARPGLVVLDLRAWGMEGPWANRGGFDQVACAATGFSAAEGSFDKPALPPTYTLNDYLLSILGAAGVVEALRRRAREGGSWRVHVDLGRAAMWVQSLGTIPRERLTGLSFVPAQIKARMQSVPGPFGNVTYLPPQIEYSELRPGLTFSAHPQGSSPMAWW